MSTFSARRYDQNSAEGIKTFVNLSQEGLESSDPSGAVSVVPYESIDLNTGGNNGERILIKDTRSGVTYVIEDKRVLDALESVNLPAPVRERLGGTRHELTQVRKRENKVWLTALGISVAAGIIIYATVAIGVEVTVRHFPVDLEKRLGQMIFTARHEKIDSTSQQNERLQKIAKKVLAQWKGNPYDFHFYLVPSETLNAYAIPGGNVVVYSELMDKASGDDEIACVLGHEIGHVKHRHTLRSMAHSTGLMAWASFLLSGDIQGLAKTMLELDKLSYGRDQETEADFTGIKMAMKAGYNPEGMKAFFERVKKLDADGSHLEFLSTHPVPEERIRNIDKAIAQARSEAKTGN